VAEVEGLEQQADVEALQAADGAVMDGPGEQDGLPDQAGALVLHEAQDGQPVGLGHDDVEDDQVEVAVHDEPHGRAPVLGDDDPGAAGGQDVVEQRGHVRAVIHDQDGLAPEGGEMGVHGVPLS